jgi:hypothetical protein
MPRRKDKPKAKELPKQVQTAIAEIAELQPEATVTLSPVQLLAL